MTARSKESILIYVLVTIFGLGSSITGALFAAAKIGDDRYVRREDFVEKFTSIKMDMAAQKTDLDYIKKAVDELRKIPAKADATSGASMSRTRRGAKAGQAQRIMPDD